MNCRFASGLWVLLALAGLPACKPKIEPAEEKAVMLELRGADGHLRLQLARAGDNFGDERLAWYAGPDVGGRLQRLPNQAGTTALEGHRVGVRRTQDDALVLSRNGSAYLNLERRGETLRLGNGDGFPTGRIQREGKTARLSGAGGELQAQAQLEGDRVAVTDRDGRALGYVVGAAGPEEALVAFLPGLQPVEQALLLATQLPASKLVKP